MFNLFQFAPYERQLRSVISVNDNRHFDCAGEIQLTQEQLIESQECNDANWLIQQAPGIQTFIEDFIHEERYLGFEA